MLGYITTLSFVRHKMVFAGYFFVFLAGKTFIIRETPWRRVVGKTDNFTPVSD